MAKSRTEASVGLAAMRLLADTRLRLVSLRSRGLLADLLGLLTARGIDAALPGDLETLSRLGGVEQDEIDKLLCELREQGIIEVLADETIEFPDLVAARRRSERMSAAGRRGGGNPMLRRHLEEAA